MKIFSYGRDGGKDSVVWGFWLCEFKPLFSIALLCFEDGSREAYHNHAFNAVSWVLKGQVAEYLLCDKSGCLEFPSNLYRPSIRPIYTPRKCFHKVYSRGRTWVLTFRGPWAKEWEEYLPDTDEFVTLTNGRIKKEGT